MASEKDKETIRERVSLVDLVSSYTKLKKAGSRYAGLCPFHGDKDPSFSVNEDLKLWHCFGCKRGGDIFSFVMEIENVDFNEAIEMLARRAGITLTPERPVDRKKKEKKDRIRTINELATKYFFKVLTSSKHGEKFLQYLEERNVSKEQIRSFKLGAAFESWDNLLNTLGKKGFSPAEIASAGLAIRRERGDGFYDRFRNRLIFPLFNVVGDVVGFAGRAYGDDMPKYLNTPETPLFDKSRLLYGLDRAKRHLESAGAIITEGYMDVIALHGAGLENAVASMGTALTGAHVDLLRRYTSSVTLSYDSDFAGDSASMRGIEMLVRAEMDVRVVSLPEGEDPDSVVQKGGREAFEEYLDGAADYFDFFLSTHRRRTGSEKPSQKSEIIRQMAPLIESSPSEILRADQKKRLADGLGITERQVYTAISRLDELKTAPRDTRGGETDEIRAILSTGEKVEKGILESIFTSRENAERILRELRPEDFTQREYMALFGYCGEYLEKNGSFEPDSFLNAVHPQEMVRILSGLSLVSGDGEADTPEIVEDKLSKFKKDLVDREMLDIKRQLEEATKTGDKEAIMRLMKRKSALDSERFG